MSEAVTDGPELYTRQEAARRLSVSLSTLQRMTLAGHVQAVRIGRSVRISRESIERYIAGEPGQYASRPESLDSPSPETWPPTSSLFSELDGLAAIREAFAGAHTAGCESCSWASEPQDSWDDAAVAAERHGETCPNARTVIVKT